MSGDGIGTTADETDRCERRGCERVPTHEVVTESPILHRKPNRWLLCDEHVRVAAEEFRGTTNILTARELDTSGRTTPQLVADGGTVEDDTEASTNGLEPLERGHKMEHREYEKPPAKRLTFRAPEPLVEELDQIIEAGVFYNRSEALREGMRRAVGEWYGTQSKSGGERSDD